MVRSRRTAAAFVSLCGLVVAVTAAQPPDLKPIGKVAPDQARKDAAVAPAQDGGPPEFRLPENELIPEAAGLASRALGQAVDWGHVKTNVPAAWAKTRGAGAVVAVLDTGIESAHPDLTGQVVKFRNFTTSSTEQDLQGHGTHCAGIIAALDNALGVVGVAPEAKLVNGKVLGDSGSGQMDWSASAVDWAVEQGADVISMSLGAPGPYPPLELAINRAVLKGVIVVVAAGNSGPGPVDYPGRYERCVTVAAYGEDGNMGDFSSVGPEVDVAAPGVQVLSTYTGGRVATLSGTSMATPYVAGVAALYVSACKKAGKKPTRDDFYNTIKGDGAVTSRPRPNPGSGYGRILADKFVTQTGPGGGDPGTGPTPRTLTLTEADFTADGWRRFRDAVPGLKKFVLELEGGTPAPTPPAPEPAPPAPAPAPTTTPAKKKEPA